VNCSLVHKDIGRAVVGDNKSKSFLGIKPLDRSILHGKGPHGLLPKSAAIAGSCATIEGNFSKCRKHGKFFDESFGQSLFFGAVVAARVNSLEEERAAALPRSVIVVKRHEIFFGSSFRFR
jgi:hypothetical protein